MTSATTKAGGRGAVTRKPSARPAAEQPVADDVAEDLGEVDDGAEAVDDVAVEGVVISPDLVFVTPKKERPAESVAERSLPFSIDGETYTLIRPAKLQETLAGLIESGARRATEADVLFAGATFLRKVLAPESLARLNARLEDDADDFEMADLFETLERIAVALIRSSPAAANRGPVPARRRAVGR